MRFGVGEAVFQRDDVARDPEHFYVDVLFVFELVCGYENTLYVLKYYYLIILKLLYYLSRSVYDWW